MQNTKKLSKKKIKVLINLFKHVVSQKPHNRINYFNVLDDTSINNISEFIYNLLYNEKLNSVLSNIQKRKLKRIIKPSIHNFETISRKKIPTRKGKQKLFKWEVE